MILCRTEVLGEFGFKKLTMSRWAGRHSILYLVESYFAVYILILSKVRFLISLRALLCTHTGDGEQKEKERSFF